MSDSLSSLEHGLLQDLRNELEEFRGMPADGFTKTAVAARIKTWYERTAYQLSSVGYELSIGHGFTDMGTLHLEVTLIDLSTPIEIEDV